MEKLKFGVLISPITAYSFPPWPNPQTSDVELPGKLREETFSKPEILASISVSISSSSEQPVRSRDIKRKNNKEKKILFPEF